MANSIDRMIAEIESYLASAYMKAADSVCEIEERRSLHELLEQLKRDKAEVE